MLILSRKTEEEIIINSDIVIKILSTSDGQVKIGISAPKNVEVLRGELYHKVKENTILASEQSKQKVTNLSNLKINRLKK
jgi:carbon storage regulator